MEAFTSWPKRIEAPPQAALAGASQLAAAAISLAAYALLMGLFGRGRTPQPANIEIPLEHKELKAKPDSGKVKAKKSVTEAQRQWDTQHVSSSSGGGSSSSNNGGGKKSETSLSRKVSFSIPDTVVEDVVPPPLDPQKLPPPAAKSNEPESAAKPARQAKSAKPAATAEAAKTSPSTVPPPVAASGEVALNITASKNRGAASSLLQKVATPFYAVKRKLFPPSKGKGSFGEQASDNVRQNV